MNSAICVSGSAVTAASSSSISIALDSITSSAAKMGASQRTASAIASLGRESISSVVPLRRSVMRA